MPVLAAAGGGDPFTFHAHPDVWAMVLSIAGAWWVATRRLAPANTPAVTRKQTVAFFFGLAVLWGFADWPVHDLSEGRLFSVHMLQHLAFALVAAPLLLMGTPPWLLKRIGRSRAGAVLRRVARPVPATLLFNVAVVVTHLPPYIDLTVRNEPVHFVAHWLLVLAALIMWLPVINRVPELPRLSLPASMLYLFAQSIVPTFPASFLAFAERPLYAAYIGGTEPWMTAIEDQQLAGALMKIGGGFLLWGSIVYLFFRWYADSQRDQGDVLTWADVERELNKPGPVPVEVTPTER